MRPLPASSVFALAAAALSFSTLAAPPLPPASPSAKLPPTTGGWHSWPTTVPQPPRATFDGVERNLADTLAPLRERHKVPALGGMILSGDRVLALGVTGVRTEGGEPVTLDDRWHLGSCGKAMTATLCALLVRDGALTWERTVGDVVNPGISDEKKKITNNWKDVTLAQLVSCTANVPGDLTDTGRGGLWSKLWQKQSEGASPLEQRAFLLESLVKNNIGKPGTRFEYANASLALAGHLAELTADEPFESLIQRRLFEPLGIRTAGFGAPAGDNAWGHTAKGKPMPPGPKADNPASIAPAGTMHMTLPDWGRFVALHLRGSRGALAPDDLLPPETFTVLHTPPLKGSDYAMGWIVTNRPQWAKGDADGSVGRCLTHAGSNTMWTCSVWIAPEIDRAFLVVCNTGAPGGAAAREDALLAMINVDRENRGLKPVKP